MKVFLDYILEPKREKPAISSLFNVTIDLLKCSGSIPLSNQYIDYVVKTFPSIAKLEQ